MSDVHKDLDTLKFNPLTELYAEMSKWGGKKGVIASYVTAEFEHARKNEDGEEYYITCPLQALYYAALRNARFNAFETKKANEVGSVFTPDLWDISFYGFVQDVMDQVCWKARKFNGQRLSADELDDLLNSSTGLDFAVDAAEEIGMDATTTMTIESDVNHLYSCLSNVSARLAQILKINSDPLHFFSPKEVLDNGTWVALYKSSSWDEAKSDMQDMTDKRNSTDPSDLTKLLETEPDF